MYCVGAVVNGQQISVFVAVVLTGVAGADAGLRDALPRRLDLALLLASEPGR